MKKVVVSCAPAGTGSGSNLGMNTVDLAIENIVKENNIQNFVEINRPWPSYIPDQKGNFPFYKDRDFSFNTIHYNNLQLLDKTALPKAVFYWGDFQHGLDYQIKTASRLKQVAIKLNLDIDFSKEGLIRKVKNYFLLQEYFKNENLPFEVCMYGVTLFQNGLNQYLDGDYMDNLKWLYRNASFAKTRESYSANTISFLKGDYNNSFLGVDCALLNTKEELTSLPQLSPQEFKHFNENIGVFFGRSTRKLPRLKLLKFINRLTKKMKKEAIKIPWNYFSGGLLADSLGIFSKGVQNYHDLKGVDFTAGDVLYGMSKLSLVITDTYHVAINAIALNIPVICIYEASPGRKGDANMGYRHAWRDKRALLFQTNNLSDFLICSEDLKSNEIINEKIENIVNLVSNKNTCTLAYSNLHSIAQNDRKLIGEYLTRIVSD